MKEDWRELSAMLAREVDARVAPAPEGTAAGGCIHGGYRWPCDGGALFVKVAPAAEADLLAAEAAGLEELAAVEAVRVPRVRGIGTAGTRAWLALEWLELTPGSAAAERRLGERLAAQHRVRADRHGWTRDNFIGRTPQANGWCADWVVFLRERRLAPQLARAAERGCSARLRERGARLLECLGVFYASYSPAPSLLHGDLWGGNWGTLAGGEPVVFDPAVHYGDREADVAMTRLFGGFGPGFYAAYQAAWPLDAAAGYRRDLHNLYHVLNHHVLFGGAYAAQAEAMVDRLLAEAGR